MTKPTRARAAETPVLIPRGHLFEPIPRAVLGSMESDPPTLDPLELLRGGLRTIDSPETPPEVRRALGRAMAGPAEEKGVTAMLQAFSALHLGELHVVSAMPDRYAFGSRDMQSASLSSRQTACHLAVGFLEGLVESVTGGLALGTEVSCRARGDEVCRFVVRSTAPVR